MSDALWMPPPDKDFAAAKRQFVDLYGSTAAGLGTALKRSHARPPDSGDDYHVR